MKSFRYLFFLLLGGLMSGCSSDNELINGSESNFIESDVEWVSAKLADVYVVEGDNSSDLTTRSADEVDPNTKNPKSALPDGIDMYIAFYQDGELQKMRLSWIRKMAIVLIIKSLHRLQMVI